MCLLLLVHGPCRRCIKKLLLSLLWMGEPHAIQMACLRPFNQYGGPHWFRGLGDSLHLPNMAKRSLLFQIWFYPVTQWNLNLRWALNLAWQFWCGDWVSSWVYRHLVSRAFLLLDSRFMLGSQARWQHYPIFHLDQGVRVILLWARQLQNWSCFHPHQLCWNSWHLMNPFISPIPWIFQSLQGSYVKYHFW